LIRKLFVKFDEELNVVCMCNVSNRKCDIDNTTSGCKEYIANFTDAANVGKRSLSKSPQKFDSKQRKLSDELSSDKCRINSINKINNLIGR